MALEHMQTGTESEGRGLIDIRHRFQIDVDTVGIIDLDRARQIVRSLYFYKDRHIP